MCRAMLLLMYLIGRGVLLLGLNAMMCEDTALCCPAAIKGVGGVQARSSGRESDETT